jgi:Pyruvate/2-oxoacid:ferredoxin oxidoreductase delta subunit
MPIFIKPSTRKFYQEWRASPAPTLFNLLHGYVYMRWVYLYLGMGIGTHPLLKKLPFLKPLFSRIFPPHPQRSSQHSQTQPSHTHADGYHGKVIPLSTAREILSVKEPIRMPDLEQVIPYTLARSILLSDPDHIAVLDCPCRAYQEHPCLPMDVCLIVGEPFAGFITEHEPRRSRRISQEEALRILEEEDRRGHVHHAFFKDAMLGRFYAICNCCNCCCGAIKSHKQGVPMLASSGYLAVVDEDQCLGCGLCLGYCQFGALDFNADQLAEVDGEICMGCGICVSKCSQQAISLRLDIRKGLPLTIQ